VGELESFVPIGSINTDRGNLSKKELSFLKSKKSTHGNVQILNQKIKVKDITPTNQQYNIFRGRRVLCSGGLNHVNPHVHPTDAY
jgi:hypothetical protein